MTTSTGDEIEISMGLFVGSLPSFPPYPAVAATRQQYMLSIPPSVPDGGATTPSWRSLSIANNSILSSKILADTDVRKKEWREKIDASHNELAADLPDDNASNTGDIHVFTEDNATASWRDLLTLQPITGAVRGDAGMYVFGQGWIKVGNLLSNAGVLDPAIKDKIDLYADNPAYNPASPTKHLSLIHI